MCVYISTYIFIFKHTLNYISSFFPNPCASLTFNRIKFLTQAYKPAVMPPLPFLGTPPSPPALFCLNGLLVPQTCQAFSSLRIFVCTFLSVWNTHSSALLQASSSSFRCQFKMSGIFQVLQRDFPFQEHPPPPLVSCTVTAGFGVLPSTDCNLNDTHISSSAGLLPVFPLSKSRFWTIQLSPSF